MIVPIMIAIIVDALRVGPEQSWTEGAAALGVNRWRVMWTISVRTARPAIIAAVILATARALGEAIMLAMVVGVDRVHPQPARRPDLLPRAGPPARRDDRRQRRGPAASSPFGQTIYAFAFVLLVSSMILSIGGYARQAPDAQVRGPRLMSDGARHPAGPHEGRRVEPQLAARGPA